MFPVHGLCVVSIGVDTLLFYTRALLVFSKVDDSDPAEELTEAAAKRKEVVGKFNRHAR